MAPREACEETWQRAQVSAAVPVVGKTGAPVGPTATACAPCIARDSGSHPESGAEPQPVRPFAFVKWHRPQAAGFAPESVVVCFASWRRRTFSRDCRSRSVAEDQVVPAPEAARAPEAWHTTQPVTRDTGTVTSACPRSRPVARSTAVMRSRGSSFTTPASSMGVIGIPSATNQPSGFQVSGCRPGVGASAGIASPKMPRPAGRSTPKRRAGGCSHRSVFPRLVELIDPASSATASYHRLTWASLRRRGLPAPPSGLTTCARITA